MANIIKSTLSTLGINIGNLEEYPVVGANYIVILGKSILSFAKISGINLYSANIKGVNEGGRYEPYMVEEAKSTLSSMKFEKGYGTLEVLKIAQSAKNMILIIKGLDNTIKGVYYTNIMMIKEVNLSELEATKSQVLIQSMTIAYTNLKELTAANKMIQLGMAGFLEEIIEYNTQDDDINAIKEYSKKLSNQKKMAKEEKKLSTSPIDTNKQIDVAANRNKAIEEKQKEILSQQQTKKQEKINAILNRIEI